MAGPRLAHCRRRLNLAGFGFGSCLPACLPAYSPSASMSLPPSLLPCLRPPLTNPSTNRTPSLFDADPIDGTTNFVHRSPQCCVLVGFCVGRRSMVGVNYVPVEDALYSAVRGCGARVDYGASQQTAASCVSSGAGANAPSSSSSSAGGPRVSGPLRCSGTAAVSKAIVHMEGGYDRSPAGVAQLTGNVTALMTAGNVRALRMVGSAGINMANVAAGISDAYLERGPMIWDYCAGQVLVEEAGGTVLCPDGKPFDLMSRAAVVGATEALARELCGLVSLEDTKKA